MRGERDEVDPQAAGGWAGIVGEVPERERVDLRVIVRQTAIAPRAFELVKVGHQDDEGLGLARLERPQLVVEQAFLLHRPVELGSVR